MGNTGRVILGLFLIIILTPLIFFGSCLAGFAGISAFSGVNSMFGMIGFYIGLAVGLIVCIIFIISMVRFMNKKQ